MDIEPSDQTYRNPKSIVDSDEEDYEEEEEEEEENNDDAQHTLTHEMEQLPTRPESRLDDLVPIKKDNAKPDESNHDYRLKKAGVMRINPTTGLLATDSDTGNVIVERDEHTYDPNNPNHSLEATTQAELSKKTNDEMEVDDEMTELAKQFESTKLRFHTFDPQDLDFIEKRGAERFIQISLALPFMCNFMKTPPLFHEIYPGDSTPPFMLTYHVIVKFCAIREYFHNYWDNLVDVTNLQQMDLEAFDEYVEKKKNRMKLESQTGTKGEGGYAGLLRCYTELWSDETGLVQHDDMSYKLLVQDMFRFQWNYVEEVFRNDVTDSLDKFIQDKPKGFLLYIQSCERVVFKFFYMIIRYNQYVKKFPGDEKRDDSIELMLNTLRMTTETLRAMEGEGNTKYFSRMTKLKDVKNYMRGLRLSKKDKEYKKKLQEERNKYNKKRTEFAEEKLMLHGAKKGTTALDNPNDKITSDEQDIFRRRKRAAPEDTDW
ncbi:MAG: hypothetical protein ACTSUE_16005 [Promethearchaeota archaeon]